ncbi:MAG: glycosyltransferase [Pseudomonadota bacterium]
MTQERADILVLLVTCSLDATRQDLAVRVVKNLAEKLPVAGLVNDFILFDNASTFHEHIQYAPKGTHVVRAPQNVGYWSAIKWVLENATQLMGRPYKYIYIVESDLYHTDLCALAECAKFLDENPDAACVRTQEFSVRGRWRYDKALNFLPFHITRSEIRLKNLVTGARAWFRKSSIENIYTSNLHAKLPALNRMYALIRVFENLSERAGFSEGDFFAEIAKNYSTIGVYDGGLFHSLYSREDKSVMSGSYSSGAQLTQTGYQQTRQSKIIPISQELNILRV